MILRKSSAFTGQSPGVFRLGGDSAGVSRRDLLRLTSMSAGASLFGSAARAGDTQALEVLDWLDLGVASGDPDTESVVLWTRIPAGGRGGIVSGAVEVTIEVSRDAGFAAASLIISERVAVDDSTFYNLKYLARGLEPGMTYYYRFRSAGGFESRIGTARTLPLTLNAGESLRFVAASCQFYPAGHYHAYDHIARGRYDFCIHLGDFIYETGGHGVRPDLINDGMPIATLAQYRAKYMLYLSDPSLQAARASAPWLYVWDDHEVVDNFSGTFLPGDLARRKANAYRCYGDFMPIRSDLKQMASGDVELPLYRSFKFANLCEIFRTDVRQYRSPPACTIGPGTPGCMSNDAPGRSMLGVAQKAWLKEAMGASDSVWKFLMNGVMMMPFKSWSLPFLGGSDVNVLDTRFFNLDAWDGFAAERLELMNFFHSESVDNVVYLTGDVHNFYAAQVHLDPADSRSPSVAGELVAASLTSPGMREAIAYDLQPVLRRYLHSVNPHLRFAEFRSHGFIEVTLNEWSLMCRFMGLSSIVTPSATLSEVGRAVIMAADDSKLTASSAV